MVEMRFHWYNENTGREGTFTVASLTLEHCVEIAEDEISVSETIYFTDYYQIS